MTPNPQNPVPDRPLECSECKKPIAIRYTEIIGETITETSMCQDCPEYQKKLHGGGWVVAAMGSHEGSAGIACGNCGITLELVRMGNAVGCSVCYEVFQEAIFQELVQAKKLPSRITSFKKTSPLHIGRSPSEAKEINASIKLLALNEALTETLKSENYEKAALLRDQIKDLTEKNPELKSEDKGQSG